MTASTAIARPQPASLPVSVPVSEPVVSLAATSPASVGSRAADLARELVPARALMLAGVTDFVKERKSPFPDGYSIEGERQALAHLLSGGDVDETDPLYPRVLLLDERERELKKMQAVFAAHEGAEAVVPLEMTQAVNRVGSLINDHRLDADSMTLHSKHAVRLFLGRRKDPSGSIPPIVGGAHVAGSLRSLFMLTGRDNPYADWALLVHERNMASCIELLRESCAAGMARIEEARERRLNYSVMVSRDPRPLTLMFKSPYGYQIAEVIVAYDQLVLIYKTLEMKSLMGKEEAYLPINEVGRVIRASFVEVSRFERTLMTESMLGLSRADFMPGASVEGKRRVAEAAHYLGMVPSDIFAAVRQPAHTRRRVTLSPSEETTLHAVSKELAISPDRFMDAAEPSAAEMGKLA